MKVIIGLGNPGSKYELTRHNIGFIALDFFASSLKVQFDGGKGDWLEAKGKIEGEDIYLIKPTTYMNNSGIAVKDFLERNGYDFEVDDSESDKKTDAGIRSDNELEELQKDIVKSDPGFDFKDVLIVVDDFQIPLGMIRVRKNGSDGGHNGLSSIMYHLNSAEFPRMRIGIGKEESLPKEEFIDFVLGVFEKEEVEIIKKMMPVYIDCMKSFITDGITRTMNNYNKKII